MNTNESFRSSNELLREESTEERVCGYEERRVTTSQKETWAVPSSWKQDADHIILSPNQEPFFWMRKWKTIPANYRRRSRLVTMTSKQVTSMCRHFDHEKCINEKVCTRWSTSFQ